ELEAVAFGPGNVRGRRAAIGALGSVATLPGVPEPRRRELAKRLADLLDRGFKRLRSTAIDALASFGKEGEPALAALDRLAGADPEPGVREAARKAAERIRAGAPLDREHARFRERRERLSAAHEELWRRLERLEANKG